MSSSKVVTDWIFEINPADIYLFKVIYGNTGAMCEIWLKLTIKIAERYHLRRSGVFVLVLPLLTLNK